MKKIAISVAAVLSLLVATNAQASHSWANYHWQRSSNPFTLPVIDSVTGVWDSLLPAVAADWTASSVLNTSLQNGATGLFDRLLCNAVQGKIRVCNANYGPNGWFGIAQVWIGSNGHILRAITEVNDFYFTGSYGNNVARRHVLCQELGHDLGLDHHNQVSCMNDANNTLSNVSYQVPNSHDYAQLETIYSHLDGASGAGPRVPSSSNVTVRRIGGETLITYVLPA